MHGSAGIPGLPCGGWRDRLGTWFPASGEAVSRLRQEVQAVNVHFPEPTSIRCYGGALQQRSVVPLPLGTHRSVRDVRQ